MRCVTYGSDTEVEKRAKVNSINYWKTYDITEKPRTKVYVIIMVPIDPHGQPVITVFYRCDVYRDLSERELRIDSFPLEETGKEG